MAGSALFVAVAVVVSMRGGPSGPEVVTVATPPPAATAAAAAAVADDDAAVSRCVQAVTRQVGEPVDRSVGLQLASTPGGWRVTAAVVSGRSFDCDVTGAGDVVVGASLASALPHLAPETVRTVVEPSGADGPVAQLKAVYRFCLDRSWGGNRALLDA